MQSIIVLGLIPGTNIQIGFFVWIGVFATLLFFIARPLISYFRVVRSVEQELSVRHPHPASQFHSRLQ
jgi:hypothetical protein